jgi:hypothetical protein
MELRHRGLLYRFDYDFAPSDETGQAWTPIHEEVGLDGSIHVHSITVNGKDRPVTTDVLALMQRAAAVKEFIYLVGRSISRYQQAGVPLSPRQRRYQEVVFFLVRTAEERPADPRRA